MTPANILQPALPPCDKPGPQRPSPDACERAPLQQSFEQGLNDAEQRAARHDGRSSMPEGRSPHDMPASLTTRDETPEDEAPAAARDIRARNKAARADEEPAIGDPPQGRGDDAAAWQALVATSRLQVLPPEWCLGTPAAPQVPAQPNSLTRHDLVATVTSAWLQEAPTSAFAALEPAHWTFTLGDAMTPLAALRISGDAVAGWHLQLTASRGTSSQALAERGERLRTRLLERGQRVEGLTVDDEEPQR
jgi:hypothetical protein